MDERNGSLTSRRRQALLRILARTGQARLSDLAAELEVSMATVRRDVAELHRHGRLSRRHGVAVLDGGRVQGARSGVPTIGMIVAQNRYLLLIADAVRREARRLGVHSLIEVAGSAAEYAAAHGRLLGAGCVGVLYAPAWRSREEMDEPVPWLLDSRIPVVLVGRQVEMGHPLFDVNSVTADHRYAMRLAVEHLHGLGHRRVLVSLHGGVPPTHRLEQSFRHELDRLGLPVVAEPARTPKGRDHHYGEIIDLIRRTDATAIIMHTDDSAQELAQELRQAGVRIPGDCSIVGYDDIVGPVQQLALASVSPPKHELGSEAMSLLMRRHVRATAGLSAAPTAHVRLLPELVVRSSTAPPRDGSSEPINSPR